MYVYVNRLFLLFYVFFALFLWASLLVLAHFLAWLIRYFISGQNPSLFLRGHELLACFYMTTAFLVLWVISYWYLYLSGVLEVALG